MEQVQNPQPDTQQAVPVAEGKQERGGKRQRPQPVRPEPEAKENSARTETLPSGIVVTYM